MENKQTAVNKKQTAMMELIERLESLSKKYQNAGLLTAIEIGNSLLEIEKQQLIDAWMVKDNPLQRLSAEKYYNETYGK